MEVRGSNPRSSTEADADRVGFWLGGFTAGEGCFSILGKNHPDPTARRRFVFEIGLASRDRAVLELLKRTLGVGSINDQPPRNERWQPQSSYRVSTILSHERATIPFMDRYLLPSHKREQYDVWKAALRAYAIERNVRWGRGRSICSIDGCDSVVRGRGVCRHHYYRLTGW